MNLKFENFVDTLQGEDILAKTDRLDEVLSSGIMTGNEALGIKSVLNPTLERKMEKFIM